MDKAVGVQHVTTEVVCALGVHELVIDHQLVGHQERGHTLYIGVTFNSSSLLQSAKETGDETSFYIIYKLFLLFIIPNIFIFEFRFLNVNRQRVIGCGSPEFIDLVIIGVQFHEDGIFQGVRDIKAVVAKADFLRQIIAASVFAVDI